MAQHPTPSRPPSGKTGGVSWVQIHAGQDHLAQFGRRKPIDAVAELIWNGLDAEADTVDVALETSSLGGSDRDLFYVTKVTVTDNGHGIDPETAAKAFPSLGDSLKKNLNGRTKNGLRALHGRLGRGRFFVYALGHRARWTSVASDGADGFTMIEITADASRIDGFTIEPARPSDGPPRTSVVITVEQGRSLAALQREDATLKLAVRLGPHLLGNPDLTVRLDGVKVDPRPLIEGDLTDIILDDLTPDDLDDREPPVLTVVDWIDGMKDVPGIVLCTEGGASLVELHNTSPVGTVRSTGYLKWSGWASTGVDLLLVEAHHPAVVDKAVQRLTEHVVARTGQLKATIVSTLKAEGSYPYEEVIADPIKDTERQIFDVLAVTARATLTKGTKQQRSMTARLLHVALQERPEELDVILGEALSLSPSERQELAEMLRVSTLGAIVGGAAEVSKRLDLLSALRHFVYDPSVAASMREVDQLHPLVKRNEWLFGEAWKLSSSEAGLATVLRQCVPDDLAFEVDLKPSGEKLLLPEELRGRVDLLLQRTRVGTNNQKERLVVELKRPSVRLGEPGLAQVRRYARKLAGHAGVGPSRWTFWLIGADVQDEISGELEQEDREWGHVTKHAKYDIHVTTWGRLIDECEGRYHFYRDQLQYNATQEEAVQRVRARHRELLPEEAPDDNA